MAGIDTIGKTTYVANQNYNGVKIDIHNPVVNVPQGNGVTQPPVRIYKYQEAQIPAEYYPQMINTNKTTVKNLPLPAPKPAAELPESVLKEKVTVPVPSPVYIEQTPAKAANIAAPENTVKEEIVTPEAQQNTTNALQKTDIHEDVDVKKIEDPDETKQKHISKVEIVPPGDTSPVIDYIKITENLDSPNYDVQALQMKEIVDAGLTNNPDKIKPYLVEPIFHSVIDIVNKDSSNLAAPTEAQNQIRAKIIENMIAYEKQKQSGVADDKIVLPNNITEEDKNYANTLTPLELAERNKEYGITTLAILAKAFLARTEQETGTVLAITDVPGLSAIVNSLKSNNPTIKLNAIDALIVIQRAEYARELTPIYEALIKTDPNESVRMAAQYALEGLNSKIAQPQQEYNNAA